jgi:hypothetical protein
MPIELKPKTSATEAAAPEAKKGLALFNEDGELTLAGQTIADFLEAADFTAVTESPDALPFLFNPAASAEDPYDVSEEGDDKEGGDDAEGGEEGGEDAPDDAGGDGEEAPAEEPAEEPADADAGDDDADGADGADADDKPDDDEVPDDATKQAQARAGEGGDEGGEEVAEVALPGAVAARLVDDSDLTEMFGYYLDQLAAVEEPTLEEQATLAVFAEYRDEDGGIAEDQRDDVAALLRSVLSEGAVYDAAEEINEKFLTKGARKKMARIRRKPKSGKRRAELKKRRREEGRGAKKAKIARQKKQFKRRRAGRLRMLAKESQEGALVFGLGDGINGANFKIGLAESPNLEFDTDQLIEFDQMAGNLFECLNEKCDAELTYAELDEKSGKCPKCGYQMESTLDEKGKVPPAFLKKMKKKKNGNGDDEEGDNGDEKGKKKDEETSESKTPAPSHVPGAFSVAAGRPNLSEGSSLAAATLGVLGRKKVLTEGED